MTSRITKWGNNLALRIPKSIALQARISEGDPVELSADDGIIIICRHPRTYSLQELVNAITPRNRHDEIDWG